MPRIFISYRRAGDIGLVARLDDWLSDRYGSENVFRDIGKLQTAEDFDREILAAMSSSDVVIAAIGNAWSGERRFRKPRIREEGDWVRKELEHALASRIPVIPVLIGGAEMPDARKLPPSLHGVLEANSGRLRDADWVSHFEDIAGAIDRVTAPGEGSDDDPAIWHAVEVPPPSRAWMGYSILAALALVVGAVLLWRYFAPAPLGVDLDDPTTWSVPPVAAQARSPVGLGALRLALLELQASTRERGENTGYNVSKFAERFGLTGVPWSAAFTTWAYGEALKRVADRPDAALPFRDAPATAIVAGSLHDKGWLTRPVTPRDLRPGDILFFERQGRIAHSEIVYTTDETRVCAIGGNVEDRVRGRCYDLPHPHIVAASAIPADAFK